MACLTAEGGLAPSNFTTVEFRDDGRYETTCPRGHILCFHVQSGCGQPKQYLVAPHVDAEGIARITFSLGGTKFWSVDSLNQLTRGRI